MGKGSDKRKGQGSNPVFITSEGTQELSPQQPHARSTKIQEPTGQRVTFGKVDAGKNLESYGRISGGPGPMLRLLRRGSRIQ